MHPHNNVRMHCRLINLLQKSFFTTEKKMVKELFSRSLCALQPWSITSVKCQIWKYENYLPVQTNRVGVSFNLPYAVLPQRHGATEKNKGFLCALCGYKLRNISL